MNHFLQVIEDARILETQGPIPVALAFGSDLSCTLDLDPQMTELAQDDPLLVAQNAVRLITIDKGTYPDDPTVGVNLYSWLRKPADRRFKAQLESAIRTEILQDERVQSLSVSVTNSTNMDSATVAINGTCATGTFRLTLALSSAGVVLTEINAQ